ncbi:MAG: heme-binding protein, partial [Pseudomonadota bacterium]
APDAAGGLRIRFLMPASHDLDSLPAPSAAEGVRLAPIPARRMAAARFGGVATDARLREATARLEAWLAAQGETAAAAPVYAYYNDPMTPGFLRRNEVLIALTDGPR